MVCHLATVHASACRYGFRLHLAFPFGQSPDEGEQLGDFGEHVFGNVAASGSRIGDELLLVELLRDFKRLMSKLPSMKLSQWDSPEELLGIVPMTVIRSITPLLPKGLR